MVASLLGPKKKKTAAKYMPYECGLPGQETVKSNVPIRFYLTGILFIMFDIEILFLYPWAISFREFINAGYGAYMFWVMLIFVGLFIFGLLWEIKSKALEWDEFMGRDAFEITINVIKMLAIFLMMVQLVPILVWVERRGSAFIRTVSVEPRGSAGTDAAPCRCGEVLFKGVRAAEEPHVALLRGTGARAHPGAIAFGAIPLSMPITVNTNSGQYVFPFQSFELGIGIVFVLAVSSLGAYALLLAGWGSNNKYSLFGALRASAQMISYELAMGLSLVGILMLYETFDFRHMVELQKGALHFLFFGKEIYLPILPNWGIFYQPLGFILFATAAFAETNRLPFDLPEAEAELVAGYHTEYGGLKMLMFDIGEYGHMLVASGLMVTFYFGGYAIPFYSSESLNAFLAGKMSANAASITTAFLLHGVFMLKVMFFLWVFIWVRWTLPRFRYDQLMDLGWKKCCLGLWRTC